MKPNCTFTYLQHVIAQIAIIALVACVPSAVVWSQEQSPLKEPIYRVANESLPQTSPPAVQGAGLGSPFDLTKQDGEHPLAPFVRVCKQSIAQIDANIRDYSCTLVKRECIDGDLGETQHISMKLRHEPFGVYMRFLQPFQGREVLFVNGQNNNEMFVLEAGWKRSFGKMSLRPDNDLVMRGQKYPITDVGIRNLLAKLVERSETDAKFAECEVTSKDDVKIGGDRMTTMVQIVHPIPRQNFRSHIARVFFDNELRVPIHYDAYLWPDQPGQKPPLEESYTYTNLKLNNGYTARDFDSENPEIFRP